MATSGSLVWGEAQVVRLLLEGRHHDAVQAVLDWLGPEVRELLLSTLQDREAADDAHARFQLAVHARLDRWSRTGSLRFWALGLARDAARETPPRRTLPYRTESLRTAPRPPASPAPIDGGPVMEDLSGLRSLLSPDDLVLLWLRSGPGSGSPSTGTGDGAGEPSPPYRPSFSLASRRRRSILSPSSMLPSHTNFM